MKLRKFKRGDNFFFQMLDDAGNVILESQSYQNKEGRDNGVESVKTNIKNADRYETISEGGKSFFILKAGNNQEIARSVGYASAGEMQTAMNYVQAGSGGGSQVGTGGTGQSGAGEYKTDGMSDDYKPLAYYESRITGVEEGFDKFSADDEHYFTYNIGGVVYLISEGYKSEASRDNGIASVEKNKPLDERYEFKQHENGLYYFNLKAGNRQEIATSRWLESDGLRAWVVGKLNGKGGGTGPSAAIAAVAEPKKKRKKRAKKPKVEKIEVSTGAYPCSGIKYQVFISGNGKHYFTYRDKEDKAILISSNIRGFATKEEVDPILDQIAACGSKPENFEVKTTTNDKFYYYLKNDEGKNIGKSFFFSTEEEMREAMKLFDCGIIGGKAPKAAPKTAAVVEAPAKKSDAREDDYLACREYKGHTPAADGFAKFEKGGEFYFVLMSGDDVKLRSEGYTTPKSRDNGIDSVKNNRDIAERWSVEEKMGYHFSVLKAGNHQEIGRSCPSKDAGSVKYSSSWTWGAAPAPQAVASAKKTDAREDDYLPCREYKGHTTEADGFARFEKRGEYYFVLMSGDDVKLRSEGYTTAKSRDNGIDSVKKNRDLPERWSVIEKLGYHFSILKAGNHQEIGRSCPSKDAGSVKYSPSWSWGAAAPIAAAAVKVPEPPKAAPAPEPIKVKAAAPAKPKDKEDDYLSCKEYEGRTVNDKTNNVALFKHEKDGQFYFALYNADGSVKLRSEGFGSGKERDEELSGVLKYNNDKDMYKRIKKGQYYMDILYDKTGREVGRSCLKKEVAKKAPAVAKAAPVVAAAAAAAIPKAKAAPAKPKEKEDDYLACKEYENRKIGDNKNKVALFKHAGDGQLYFVLYDKNGEVKLRSEGFKTGKKRDSELEEVLKFHNDKKMYKRIKRGAYYMDVLYDKSGREVGRSCLKKEVAVAPVVAAAAAAPVAKKVVAETKKAAPVVAETSSGFNWMWLLPLLLLPLLWFLCNKCETPEVATPVIETPVVEAPVPTPPPAPTPEPEPTPEPIEIGCQCDAKNISIFNVPSGPAVSLARLGSLPEFGNSHGLTPSQFYSKLSDRYSTDLRDRAYLDYLFKSMGYRNGFSGANASLFSAVTLDRGTKGLLGFGEYHGYDYYQLDTPERDRRAFHIKAANGCDVHFMKTCGNYMFFCD